MIYQCNKCEFNSFNEKALQQHIKEEHTKPVPKVVQPTPPAPKPAEVAQPENKEPKKEKKPEINFYNEFRNKPITCQFINGQSISGTLIGFNQWELKIKTAVGDVLVYKHSLATLKMVES